MKIHALRTGSVAVHERQREGTGPGPLRTVFTLLDREWTEPLPILCWLIEHPEGLIVVDTGETGRAAEPGYFPRWHPYFRFGVREWVEADEEVGPALLRLGFDPADVRWVLMTHLHTDHAGGLEHFPDSDILVCQTELANASGALGKLRGFLPQRWPRSFSPRAVEFTSNAFESFPQSIAVTEAGDVHLVFTPGHTAGHMSVVVEEEDHVIFFAGDTSYTEELLLRGAVDGVTTDPKTAARTLERIRSLASARPTVYLPSHDPGAPDRLAERRFTPHR